MRGLEDPQEQGWGAKESRKEEEGRQGSLNRQLARIWGVEGEVMREDPGHMEQRHHGSTLLWLQHQVSFFGFSRVQVLLCAWDLRLPFSHRCAHSLASLTGAFLSSTSVSLLGKSNLFFFSLPALGRAL